MSGYGTVGVCKDVIIVPLVPRDFIFSELESELIVI